VFDQFLLFGADPNPPSTSSRLLAMFPSTDIALRDAELDQVKEFCFPDGFSELPGQPGPILTQFLFLLNHRNTRIFGICVQIANPLNFSTSWSRRFPFSLCFLSQCPFLSSHFQFAAYLSRLLCGQISLQNCHLQLKKSIGRPTLSVRGFCHPSLTLDRSFPAIAVARGLSAPKLLFDELLFFYSLPTRLNEARPDPLTFLTPDTPFSLPLRFPEAKCLAYPTLHVLFSSLDIPTIIHLYTAILLEERVLLVSKSLFRASFCVAAALALIAPFTASASVLPIVPRSSAFVHLFDSPIPFLYGAMVASGEADLIVDLDRGEIVKSNANLPGLPRAAVLRQQLEALIEASLDKVLVPPRELATFFGRRRPNPDYAKFIAGREAEVCPKLHGPNEMKYIFTPFLVEDVLAAFGSHIAPVISEQGKNCFVTDVTDATRPVTVLNTDLFPEQFALEEKPFWVQFAGTQMFDVFWNRMADDHSRTKARKRKPSLYDEDDDLRLVQQTPTLE
jgi:hypothetical protein